MSILNHTKRRELTRESAQSTEKRSNTEPYVNLVACANLHAVSCFRDQANNQCRCRRFFSSLVFVLAFVWMECACE